MKKNLAFIITIIASVLTCHCGSNNSNQNSTVNPKTVKTSSDGKSENQDVSFVKGATYKSVCKNVANQYAGIKFPGFQVTYVEGEQSQFVRKNLLSTTEDCDSVSVIVKDTGKVMPQNFQVEETTVTISNALVAEAFNRAKICGITDWETDKERPINEVAPDTSTGTTCLTGTSPRAEPTTLLFENGKLFLVTEPLDKPFDQDFFFTRQTTVGP